MKTRMILAAMLLLAFGSVKAQEKPIPTPDGDASKINTLVVNGTGSVYLKQGEKLTLNDYGHNSARYRVEDSVLYLDGNGAREVTLPNLTYLKATGTAGVRSKGALKGENLSIFKTGTGELSLEVGYNNIYVRSTGIGDVVLLGDCNVFCSETKGIGKVNVNSLNYKVLVERSGDLWNMAMNLDENVDKEWVHLVTEKAQPFFEAESQKSWNQKTTNDKGNMAIPDMAELDELMREYNANLQRIHDSIDWKRIHEEMRQAGQEIQRAYDSVDWEQFERDMEKWGEEMEKWGRKMEKWGERFERKHGKDEVYHYEHNNTPSGCGTADQANKPSKRSLLLDPHWQGFEAGLNMLLDPTAMDIYTGNNGYMETRPLRSWYFGFNIADVGIAFDRNKRVGMFTGVGLGWNNYSWKNYIQMTVDNGELVNTLLPDDRLVKNSKMGVLYLQVPLMVEVRPTKRMYIDLGVTGGVRLAAWTRIKYADGQNVKSYSGYLTNLLKCDASLRIGGENVGFFVNYALVPMFTKGRDANKAHPLSLGFSIVF